MKALGVLLLALALLDVTGRAEAQFRGAGGFGGSSGGAAPSIGSSGGSVGLPGGISLPGGVSLPGTVNVPGGEKPEGDVGSSKSVVQTPGGSFPIDSGRVSGLPPRTSLKLKDIATAIPIRMHAEQTVEPGATSGQIVNLPIWQTPAGQTEAA